MVFQIKFAKLKIDDSKYYEYKQDHSNQSVIWCVQIVVSQSAMPGQHGECQSSGVDQQMNKTQCPLCKRLARPIIYLSLWQEHIYGNGLVWHVLVFSGLVWKKLFTFECDH